MKFHPDDIVKSCRKLESGLRLGIEGVHACQLGPFSSPIYWSASEAGKAKITKEMIVEKRRWLFELLNDDKSDITCKSCHMVVKKNYRDVNFSRLGHIDLAASTLCNLRCCFCGYTLSNNFKPAQYDALSILREFKPKDVEWDAAVDFNGGEPTLLPDFSDYIEYFNSRRIRIYLYTNGVRFSRPVYDGIAKGNIRWVCTSLDAGCPSTFKRVKGADAFLQVVENLTRYAHAGNQGGGFLSVKYIFCEENCSDDDVAGFSYAMLAIRPQRVWLTFDFEPLKGISPIVEDFGGYDFSKHVNAYAKTYRLLKKHGVTAGHFTENHLAAIGKHGKILLEKSKQATAESNKVDLKLDTELALCNLRKETNSAESSVKKFDTKPLRILRTDKSSEKTFLEGKRLLLVPACNLTESLLEDPQISQGDIVGFVDRDPVLHGKKIQGIPIYDYGSISKLDPDIILVAAPKQHREDILGKVESVSSGSTSIWAFEREDEINF